MIKEKEIQLLIEEKFAVEQRLSSAFQEGSILFLQCLLNYIEDRLSILYV